MSGETNYEDANIFDLLSELNPGDQERCAALDPHIAKKFVDVESLAEAYYYMCYGDLHRVLPETRKRVNSILDSHLGNSDNIEWWRFEAYKQWLDDDLKEKLTVAWLQDDTNKCVWIAESIPSDSSLVVPALSRLTNIYKSRRSTDNLKAVETLFQHISKDYLEDACKALGKSTPAVSVYLLSRDDVNEKYTLKGLKALSKLSKQRSVKSKVDFKMLGHLGPKARIDAMRQLLGMLNSYNKQKDNNPFTDIPSHEEVETFLFPCSLKYNDQVVELIKEFDNLVNNTLKK